MDKIVLLGELKVLRGKLEAAEKRAEEERQVARAMMDSMGARIAIQAEMLGRSAEARGATCERVKELEDALAPFAAIMAGGWDVGHLADDAVYPVRLADLRRAAKALAGTNYTNRAA